MEAINQEVFAYVRKMGYVEELLASVHRAFYVHVAKHNELLEREVNKRTEELSRAYEELKNDFVDKFIQHLTKRVKKAIKSIEKREGIYELPTIEEKYEFLDKYPNLRKLILDFYLLHLNPMKKSSSETNKFIVFGLNQSMAFRRISYHRVKSFAELLGKEDGIKLYTKILTKYIEYMTQKFPQKDDISVSKYCENAIKGWCSIGMADFVSCVLAEHKIHFRFDSCFAHEALKDFNDPDIAYYASCYGADLPAFNEGRIINVRRTQTLHHADFCDEFYWDTREFDEPPEQPSLEFTKNMNQKTK